MYLVSKGRKLVPILRIKLQEVSHLPRLPQRQVLVLQLGLISSEISHLLVNGVSNLGSFASYLVVQNNAHNII